MESSAPSLCPWRMLLRSWQPMLWKFARSFGCGLPVGGSWRPTAEWKIAFYWPGECFSGRGDAGSAVGASIARSGYPKSPLKGLLLLRCPFCLLGFSYLTFEANQGPSFGLCLWRTSGEAPAEEGPPAEERPPPEATEAPAEEGYVPTEAADSPVISPMTPPQAAEVEGSEVESLHGW